MKISENSIIVIPGEFLKRNESYNLNITLKSSENTLVKGKVNNADGTPSIGACIEVVEVSKIERIKGHVFTNENGEFAFSIKYKSNVDYKLNVYSSI